MVSPFPTSKRPDHSVLLICTNCGECIRKLLILLGLSKNHTEIIQINSLSRKEQTKNIGCISHSELDTTRKTPFLLWGCSDFRNKIKIGHFPLPQQKPDCRQPVGRCS